MSDKLPIKSLCEHQIKHTGISCVNGCKVNSPNEIAQYNKNKKEWSELDFYLLKLD